MQNTKKEEELLGVCVCVWHICRLDGWMDSQVDVGEGRRGWKKVDR